MTDGAGAAPPTALHLVESWQPVLSGYTTRGWALVSAQQRDGHARPHVLVSSRQRLRGVAHADAVAPASSAEVVASSAREQRRRRVHAYYTDRRALADAVVAACERHGADLIHCHASSTIGAAAADAARRTGLPLVAEVRYDLAGAVMTETVRRPLPPLEWALRRWFERYLHRADALVAASYTLADLLRRNYPGPAERLVVVPNGADCDVYTPGPADPELVERYGLRGKTVVGTTSNVLRYEGLELILRALAELKPRRPDLHALFVGARGSPLCAELTKRAGELGVAASFTERVDPQQIPACLRLIDIFAVPRHDAAITRYASPIKLVEAMAAGRAAVASRLGDTATLLADGRGRLVEPGSTAALAAAIDELAGDAALRAELGAAAAAWARRHLDWRAAAALYRDAYRLARERRAR